AAEGCADGAVARYYRYDPYGATKAFKGDGTAVTDASELLVDRLFTGQRSEWSARLYDYNARFYDPRTPRFVRADPVRQFANPYAYVGWRPTSFVDRTGMVFSPANLNFTAAGPDIFIDWSWDVMVSNRMGADPVSPPGLGAPDGSVFGDLSD